MQNQGKVILFIANSLDGFIAKPDGDISFLSKMEKAGEDYGYATFMETIDAVMLGRKTYDKVVSMGYIEPYGNKPTYVISNTPKPDSGSIKYFSGDLPMLVSQIRESSQGNIFLDGGAALVNSMLKMQLINEIIISVIPVILGSGIRLFQDDNQEHLLTLIQTKHFDSGLVQMHYRIDY